MGDSLVLFLVLVGYQTDGSALRRLRLLIPLSIDELAAKAGVSHMTIRAIEQSVTLSPRPETIRRIAEALNCDTTDFMVIDDGTETQSAV